MCSAGNFGFGNCEFFVLLVQKFPEMHTVHVHRILFNSNISIAAGLVLELPSVPANLSHVEMCPTPDTSQSLGSCDEECSDDTSCGNTKKCCSNGCGHSCTTSTSIPYYKPPMSCPSIDSLLGVFCSIDFGCKSNEVCQEDELCCPTGCGSMCMKAVKPSPICSAVVNSTRNVSIIMINNNNNNNNNNVQLCIHVLVCI